MTETMDLARDIVEITFDFGLDADYTGKYVADPTTEGEVLATANKRMMRDVTINPIHYDEVTNLGGGLTATIGLV